jgi:hypothetical protein
VQEHYVFLCLRASGETKQKWLCSIYLVIGILRQNTRAYELVKSMHRCFSWSHVDFKWGLFGKHGLLPLGWYICFPITNAFPVQAQLWSTVILNQPTRPVLTVVWPEILYFLLAKVRGYKALTNVTSYPFFSEFDTFFLEKKFWHRSASVKVSTLIKVWSWETKNNKLDTKTNFEMGPYIHLSIYTNMKFENIFQEKKFWHTPPSMYLGIGKVSTLIKVLICGKRKNGPS